MVGLQEKAKTFISLNGSQCIKNFIQVILQHFYCSYHAEFLTLYKCQLAFLKNVKKVKNDKNGKMFCSNSSEKADKDNGLLDFV